MDYPIIHYWPLKIIRLILEQCIILYSGADDDSLLMKTGRLESWDTFFLEITAACWLIFSTL